MEPRSYNSELRALLAIRNFSKVLEKHYEQMLEIEDAYEELTINAGAIIEAHCSVKDQERWKASVKEVNDSIFSINRVLNILKTKVVKKERSDSSELWKRYDSSMERLKRAYKQSEKIGHEILPMSERLHWQVDICSFEDTILPLIISHANACKKELEFIEKYTPKELHKITQVIFDHIPENFTFEDADKYEIEYMKALEELKKEFNPEKNLWDKFLDVLAGGTHQPPSERVMLQRWINGEKKDL